MINKLGLGFVLAFVAIVIAAVIGWVMNLIQLIQMGTGDITTTFVIKVVGLFLAPLGAIMGWLG